MYEMDPTLMVAINSNLSCLSIGIEIMDADNKVIDCRYIPLGKLGNEKRHYEGPVTFDSAMGNACLSPQLFIAPFADGRIAASTFFENVSFRIWGGREAIEELEFELKPEDLAKVAKIVCKVTPAGISKTEE